MSVANDTSATGIRGFLVKLYKPIYLWAKATFATTDEVLHPVNVMTLTPSSTFVKNALIGINGVLYRSTQATTNLPCTMVVENGAFVVETVNGKIAFVVTDPTPNAGWEIFSDASTEYWLEQFNQSISDLSVIRTKANSALQTDSQVTYNGTTYSVGTLLEEMAKLMDKTVVTQ